MFYKNPYGLIFKNEDYFILKDIIAILENAIFSNDSLMTNDNNEKVL